MKENVNGFSRNPAVDATLMLGKFRLKPFFNYLVIHYEEIDAMADQ